MVTISQQVSEIERSLSSFKSQHNEKARLLSSLYAELGYGGMIHSLKNFILRKGFEGDVKVEHSLGALQGIVKQYAALSSSPAEQVALLDIQAMIDENNPPRD